MRLRVDKGLGSLGCRFVRVDGLSSALRAIALRHRAYGLRRA